MKRALLAAASAAALVAAAAAFAPQDDWERQVRRQLQAVAERMQGDGFEMGEALQTGALDEQRRQTLELELEAGLRYHLVGVCDSDCSDLDLVLFDGAGQQLDIDVAEDATPVVSTEVSRSGAFRLEVRMAACSAEPCRFGVAAFSRR